jgi:cbb3-type cytochrome oxidase maturation protein
MESLYVLVPLSVVLVFLIGFVFWRAVHSGQFDDLDRPGQDVVADDDKPK